MNTRKVEGNGGGNEGFGKTPFAQVFLVVGAMLLGLSVVLNVLFSTAEQSEVLDYRSLGYVGVAVDEEGFVCNRHIGPNNEVNPCPEDWVRYRQVHVVSEAEQREIEAARVTLATRRE